MVNGRPLWQFLAALWFLIYAFAALTSFAFKFAGWDIILGIAALCVAGAWFFKIGGL